MAALELYWGQKLRVSCFCYYFYCVQIQLGESHVETISFGMLVLDEETQDVGLSAIIQ